MRGMQYGTGQAHCQAKEDIAGKSHYWPQIKSYKLKFKDFSMKEDSFFEINSDFPACMAFITFSANLVYA
jgi:hypothetical protein